MATPEQLKADRLDRLSHSVTLASKLQPLVADPDVKEAFDAIEKSLIETLISAKTSEARDRVAAEVNAWRKVRAAIASLANSGKHSSQKIEQLTRSNDNGSE